MNFHVAGIANNLGAEFGVAPAHVAAVIAVESAGVYEPCQIRWEGHYFYRLLSGEKRAAAVKAGLASPKVGGVKNPRSQAKRQAMLEKAMKIDREAAISSTSWGVGQVMGAHWKVLGFASADCLRTEAIGGLAGQARLMMRYVHAFGLLDELQEGRWAAFARGYNGPGYRKNAYDTKLATAAADSGGVVAKADGMLRLGSEGARVRELQALIVRAGFQVKVDGDFGPTTRDMVKAFQRHLGLKDDGVAGPKTMAAFSTYRVSPDEKLGAVSVTDIPNLDKVVATVGGGAVLAQAKASVETLAAQAGDLAGQVAGIPTLASYATTAASGLVTVAAVLGVAAAGYAAWQWLKSHRTYEGVPA